MDVSALNTVLKANRRLKEIAEAERLEGSLYEFVKAAWQHFDPSDFVGNWHLEDVCDHLEAVARGHINRLLINVPPRTGKSNIASICFVPWVWAQRTKGQLMGPAASFFYASYNEQLALEHSLKARRLIESQWYQRLWGGRFKLVSDRNRISHFENDKGGYRMSSSVDARSTGWGASAIFADDPHLVKEAESEKVREDVVKWWSESMPSRLNDRRTGAMVVIMQRVHEGDVAGYVLAAKLGYVHLCVPMCYVPANHINAWVGDKIETFIGDDIDGIDDDDVFWVDPRSEDGDLLWTERYPASEVAKLEKELGPYAFASQYQQTPAPRGGGIIRTEWWQLWDEKTANKMGVAFRDEETNAAVYPPFEYILASLDTAYTEDEENDPSALSIWGIFRDPNGQPRIFLIVCWAERMAIHELVSRVGANCKKWKVDRLLIEDKAAGHSVSQELARLFGLLDFGIELVNPRTGFIKSPDKSARLQTVVHLFAEGLIYAPDKEWADQMIQQCATVPRAIHDDLADTCSMALLYLRRTGWAIKREERAIEEAEEIRYRPKAGALYGGI
jgi:predicted phage terminase large subunit-like protein